MNTDEPFDADDSDVEWTNKPFEAVEETVTAFGLARSYTGSLVGAGWSNTADSPDCGALPGFYAADADAPIRFKVTSDSYICMRGRLDTTEHVEWDLTLVRIIDDACDGPLSNSADRPFGLAVTRPDVVWGTNVEPGTYAVVIGAYQPATMDIEIPYTVGVSIWAPFDGSAEQCPLLEDAP